MLRPYAILVALAIVACGGPAPDPDAGPRDGAIDASDGGQPVAPVVVSTLPRDGDVEVSPTTSIRVLFSAAMDPQAGTIEARAGEDAIALGAASFGEDGRELTVTPAAPLPGNTSIRIVVRGHRDAQGTVMAGEHAFDFTTSDPFAPTVASATPAEGASDVDPAASAIVVEFSEAMNAALGLAELSGGPGAIERPTWDGSRATFAVSGLAPDTHYRVALIGFADPAGNALDGAPYLGDGALDFTTGADTVAPFVTEATPAEGQTGLPPNRTTRVRVIFDEPMDPSAGEAVLEAAGEDATLSASWAGGDTILILDVSGLLESHSTYRIRLEGFTDRAGNALDGAPYLGDGALDFSTAGDELPPFVLYTNPAETEAGIRWTTNSLFVTFSEAMDTSVVEVPYTDGVSSSTFSGTWSSGGALLALDVAGRLISGRTYVLDFTAFQDADGTPLDVTHPYLGDGRLTFTMAAPEGENCQDFLTNEQATVTAEGHHLWTIGTTQVTNVDGAAPCDLSGGSADAVVRYRKTTPDSTDPLGAGTVLRVTVTSSSTISDRDINLDVLRDACDPTSSVGARLVCRANGNPHSVDLDVPAGDYFVWVAASALTFRGATVRIEEIPAGVGDTCRNAIPITPGMSTLTPSGTRDIDAPSCTAGALTWYRYTATRRLGLVQLDAARAVGAIDANADQPLLCRADTTVTPLPVVVEPGQDVCFAVSSGSSVSVSITERDYTGVRGIPVNLDTTYPEGTLSGPSTPFMGVSPSRVYVSSTNAGSTSRVYHAPREGGVRATAQAFPTGARVPGPSGVLIGETYYSAAAGGFSLTTPLPMLLQITDATGEFLETPIPIDTDPTYVVAGSLAGILVEGDNFLIVQGSSTTGGVTHFYALPITGGTPVHLGSNNHLHSVSAFAADATYFYVISRLDGGGQASEGIYRIRRDQLSEPDSTPFLVYGGGHDWNNSTGALFLASDGTSSWMYFRTYGPGHIHLLMDPSTDTPLYLGPLWTTATNNQTGMAYDPVTPALYFVDQSSGKRWMRLD